MPASVCGRRPVQVTLRSSYRLMLMTSKTKHRCWRNIIVSIMRMMWCLSSGSYLRLSCGEGKGRGRGKGEGKGKGV